MASLDSVVAAQYGTNVYALAQQKGSLLRNAVTVEPMKGEKRTFERVAPSEAERAGEKYATTKLIHTNFSRRTAHAREYVWADIVDYQDDINIFIDPTSHIVRIGAYALGRKTDFEIINYGLAGDAYEGKDGLTVVPFPTAQQIPVTLGGNGENTGFNIEKLIEVRSMFGKADVDMNDPENEAFIAISQWQMDDLARSTDVRSRDYEAIRDLYTGKTDKFLGFRFIVHGKLILNENIRTCAAWIKSGVVLVEPRSITMSVDTRPDMNNNWQALGKMKCGATRLEDAKVVQIFCQETH